MKLWTPYNKDWLYCLKTGMTVGLTDCVLCKHYEGGKVVGGATRIECGWKVERNANYIGQELSGKWRYKMPVIKDYD